MLYEVITPRCGTVMVIDEWSGWLWTCFHCDFVGDVATDEETEQQENEFKKNLMELEAKWLD